MSSNKSSVSKSDDDHSLTHEQERYILFPGWDNEKERENTINEAVKTGLATSLLAAGAFAFEFGSSIAGFTGIPVVLGVFTVYVLFKLKRKVK